MITREELLNFIVVDLGLSPGQLEDFNELTFRELVALAEYKREKEKERYMMIQRAVMWGIESVVRRKEIPMFKKSRTTRTTKEEKEAVLKELKEEFGGFKLPQKRG